jgi:hypothetical protein
MNMDDDATSEAGYTLVFPFKIRPDYDIASLDSPVEYSLNGLTLILERKNEYHKLKVTGFKTKEAAQAYVPRLWLALNWLLLNHSLPFRANPEIGDVKYGKEIEAKVAFLKGFFSSDIEGPIDGLVSHQNPYVHPSDKQVVAIRAEGKLRTDKKLEMVLPLIEQGMAAPDSELDQKLQVALELYNSHFYETSPSARFLTLVIALETLTTPPPRPASIINMVKKWEQEVSSLQKTMSSESHEYKSLESLKGQLAHFKEESIRSQVKALVYETLKNENELNADKFASRAVKIYDRRSTLVHNGYLPAEEVNEAEKEAKEIVRTVLTVMLRSIIAPSE